jgi:23S rRNA (uracil1939-C5)-methyltransferase
VVDSLARIAHLDLGDSIETCVAPSEELGYRNKVELRRSLDPGGLELGFSKLGSDEIVPVAECLLMPENHRGLLRSARGALRFLAGRENVEFDRVALRTAHNTRDVQVALWTQPSPFPRDLVARTLSEATSASSIVRVVARGGDARDVSSVERLHGKSWWAERFGGLRYGVSAPSFFQVNTLGAERLVSLVSASLSSVRSVADLYAGVGTFTLPLAERVDHVTAIEASKWALSDLRHNLERAEVHAEVRGGDAAYETDDLDEHDALVIDPPRSGLADAMPAALASLEPAKIVYVSCDPATFARDARRIVEQGYRVEKVTPIDLFPQTYHTELVSVFGRSDR